MALIIVLILLAVMLIVSRATAVESNQVVQLTDLIKAKASDYGLDPAIMLALAEIESSFNPRAVNPSDPSYGLFQISPALAQDYGYVANYKAITEKEKELLLNPEVSADIACRHMARLLKSYDLDTAVQMYNVGVSGYLNGKRAQKYLEKFKKAYQRYKAS